MKPADVWSGPPPLPPGVRTLWAYRDVMTQEITWCTWSSEQGVRLELYEAILDVLQPAFTHWKVMATDQGTRYAQIMIIPEGDRPPPGALTWAEALKQARIYAKML